MNAFRWIDERSQTRYDTAENVCERGLKSFSGIIYVAPTIFLREIYGVDLTHSKMRYTPEGDSMLSLVVRTVLSYKSSP